MSERRFALVAGGGTAGHTVPALAVARAIAEDVSSRSVELVGSKRGLDSRLLDGVELPVTLLGGRGFVRRVDASALKQNLSSLVELVSSFLFSLALVARRRPAVVVAVGGYACVAPALAAAVFGIPVIVLNVDAKPGAANRLVARVARVCAVAYPGTGLPRAVVTGPPVRSAVQAAKSGPGARQRARSELGLPRDAKVVAAFGGSLGAGRVNEAVLDVARRWSGRSDVAIFHVVGERNLESARDEALRLGLRGWSAYVQVPFEKRMELVYAACDVAVCRAGANTVAELTVTGTPAVLVPLPGAPGDHQNANASVLASAGAAVVVQDADLDGGRLSRELESLLSDPVRLQQMSSAGHELGKPDAAYEIAELAEGYARRRRKGVS